MDNVLITGGAGFIGSHIVDEIISMGMNPIVIDDLSCGSMKNINTKAEFIFNSITENSIDKIFKRCKFKYVYHFAAYASIGLSHFIKKYNYKNNLIGSVNLINAAVNNGVKCFVFASSNAVYGSAQSPMKENMVPKPEDSYGIAKYAVEQELEISHKMFGLNYIVFRLHNVYGPRQNITDRYRNVIGIFINQILNKRPLSIFGDGKQLRAYTYIKDVIPTMTIAPFDKAYYNQVFNLGSDTCYTINKLAVIVCKVMDVKNYPVEYLPARKEVVNAYSDHSKIKKIYGLRETDLEEGIAKMIDWIKKTDTMPQKKSHEIEINKNFPEAYLKEMKDAN